MPHPANGRLSKASYTAVPTVIDDKTPIWCHEVLDSTTQEVGFNYTCLEGLTPDLLYSPTDAFAQSCWEILFPAPSEPELEQLEAEPVSPISSFPPSYTTLPEFYAQSAGSSSRSTIRQPEQDKEDEHSFTEYTSGDYFWDDKDDHFEGDDGYDEELDNVTSFNDEVSDIGSESSFSHSDAIRNHPIIDTDFAVKEDLFLHDLSPVDWKSSLMCWEDSLPISVVFREMPINNRVRKPSKLSAWRAKIPVLPFRSTPVHNNNWS